MRIGLLVVLAGALAIGWWYWSGTRPPRQVVARIEKPQQVSKGDEFELRVHLTNQREDRPFHLTEIVIDQPFDDFFNVVSVTPSPVQRHRFKLAIIVLYKFDVLVPPRSTKVVTFRLRAAREGFAAGDFLIYEGRHALKQRETVEVVAK